MIEPTVIRMDQQYQGTDDIEFYSCHRCGFERVPRVHPSRDRDWPGASDVMTAKYCPGCGRPVEWV